MREKLNSNPLAQLAVIGVLLLLAAVFVMSSMGGGSEKAEESGEAASAESAVAPAVPTEAGSPTSLPAVSTGVGAPPPIPRPVAAAFAADDTVVLLFVRNGGIDAMTTAALLRLHSLTRVATFVVPASRIARYAAIAQGANVNRVPAMVVLRPKRLDNGIPTASVHYGYQSPESVEQAVIDAGYHGRTVPYHP